MKRTRCSASPTVSLVSWLIVAVAVVLLFLIAWIVVPGWTYPLLGLSLTTGRIKWLSSAT